MKPLLAVLSLLLTTYRFASFERTQTGSRSTALGNSIVASTNNEWAAFSNPAALRELNSAVLSLSYHPSIFEVKELSHLAATFVVPTSVGSFAISASRFGLDLYKETNVALSFAERIADGLSGGISLGYYSLSIQNYGSAFTFGVDAGLLVDIVDELHWGFTAKNLNAPRIGDAKEKLPQIFMTGIEYNPVANVGICASVVKDVRWPVGLHVGVEYRVFDMVALRGGSTSDPSTYSAGIGIAHSLVKFDYAFSSHSELGGSHQFSVSLRVGEF